MIKVFAGAITSLALKPDGYWRSWGVAQKSGYQSIDLAAGDYHILWLNSNGVVSSYTEYSSGNSSGQCDIPSEIQGNVVAIGAGSNTSLALLNNGGVAAWGYEGDGYCDIPTSAQSNIVAIDGGTNGTTPLALKSDGALVTWGLHDCYMGKVEAKGTTLPDLGSVAIVEFKFLPVTSRKIKIKGDLRYPLPFESFYFTQIYEGSPNKYEFLFDYENKRAIFNSFWSGSDSGKEIKVELYYFENYIPSNLNNVIDMASGCFDCFALKSDKTVIAWGENKYGACDVPSEIQGYTIKIATSSFNSLALKNDGTIVYWGLNNYGEANIPSEIQGKVVSIAVGIRHCLAATSDGYVYAWGQNSRQCDVPAELAPPPDGFEWTLPKIAGQPVTENLSHEEWTAFQDAINTKRAKYNLSNYSFTPAYTNHYLNAGIFNEVITAINEVYTTKGETSQIMEEIRNGVQGLSQGVVWEVKASYFEGAGSIRDALNNA